MDYKFEIPQYCYRILRDINKRKLEAFIVGGAVRDMVMGKEPCDFDIATAATPEEVMEILAEDNIKTIDTSAVFGTIIAVIDNHNVEITTYRLEGKYKDNRHPDTVVFSRSMVDDILRRDFTINSLYLAADGDMLDLMDGTTDIEEKIIKTCGKPKQCFEEDALRILRALRFASVLGFEIEESTLKAMNECIPLLGNIAAERISSELIKLLTASATTKVLRENRAIFEYIIPGIKEINGFDQHSKYHEEDVWTHTLSVIDNLPFSDDKRDKGLVFAALFHDMGKPSVFELDDEGNGHMKGHSEVSARIWGEMSEKLKLPTKLRQEVLELIEFHDTFPKPTRESVHRFMTNHSIEVIDKLHILQRADILAHSNFGQDRMSILDEIIKIYNELKREEVPVKVSDLEIDGKDLMSIGVLEGVKIGVILKELLEMVISEKIQNKHEELMEVSKTIINKV